MMTKMTTEMKKCFNEMTDRQKIRMFYELTKYINNNIDDTNDDDPAMDAILADVANIVSDIKAL